MSTSTLHYKLCSQRRQPAPKSYPTSCSRWSEISSRLLSVENLWSSDEHHGQRKPPNQTQCRKTPTRRCLDYEWQGYPRQSAGRIVPGGRWVMQAVLQRDAGPEVVLRRALHSAGLRFRKECRPEPDLRCKSDIVFRAHKVCVFVDGCFWHRCPLHFVLPRTNAVWWDEKVQATVDRDLRQMRTLKARGWRVVHV